MQRLLCSEIKCGIENLPLRCKNVFVNNGVCKGPYKIKEKISEDNVSSEYTLISEESGEEFTFETKLLDMDDLILQLVIEEKLANLDLAPKVLQVIEGQNENDENSVGIVRTKYEKSLLQKLQDIAKSGEDMETQTQDIQTEVRQSLNAIYKLHKNQIVHGDMTIHNIVESEDGDIMFIHFDAASEATQELIILDLISFFKSMFLYLQQTYFLDIFSEFMLTDIFPRLAKESPEVIEQLEETRQSGITFDIEEEQLTLPPLPASNFVGNEEYFLNMATEEDRRYLHSELFKKFIEANRYRITKFLEFTSSDKAKNVQSISDNKENFQLIQSINENGLFTFDSSEGNCETQINPKVVISGEPQKFISIKRAYVSGYMAQGLLSKIISRILRDEQFLEKCKIYCKPILPNNTDEIIEYGQACLDAEYIESNGQIGLGIQSNASIDNFTRVWDELNIGYGLEQEFFPEIEKCMEESLAQTTFWNVIFIANDICPKFNLFTIVARLLS